MAATIYYDNDADLSHLKDKTIAILGYGSQGHAQAQNLRDSGCKVIIGQRPGGKNYDLAVTHGFQPMEIDEATKKADKVDHDTAVKFNPDRVHPAPAGQVLMAEGLLKSWDAPSLVSSVTIDVQAASSVKAVSKVTTWCACSSRLQSA